MNEYHFDSLSEATHFAIVERRCSILEIRNGWFHYSSSGERTPNGEIMPEVSISDGELFNAIVVVDHQEGDAPSEGDWWYPGTDNAPEDPSRYTSVCRGDVVIGWRPLND